MEQTSNLTTPIVYVLVSSPDDFFVEQLWGSLYSLRHFHPDAKVVVLTDGSTRTRIMTDDKLRPIYGMISELKEVDVPEQFCGVLRSRFIKTQVRNLIEGDYLYMDTDTIISGPLDGIDRLEVKNLAMVPDLHRQHSWSIIWDVAREKMLFGVDIKDARATYFNAGVTYVKDNKLTRDFFAKWHENWLHSVEKGYYIDQPALFYTDHTFGHIIEKLPDVYNCMGAHSAFYWNGGNVIHYLDKGLPFRTLRNIPKMIHKGSGITDEVRDILFHPKNHLSAGTCFCSQDDFDFLNGAFCQFCMNSKVLRWCISKFNDWEASRRVKRLNKWK